MHDLTQDLIAFLKESPTAFHAADAAARRLENAGFARLLESEGWALKPGGKYYVVRNDSSVIAFALGTDPGCDGFAIAASHSDSPTFKLKEKPLLEGNGYLRLNVEKYGGPIYATWLDRPLTLGGRLTVRTDKGVESRLCYIDRDLLLIPNVCIHLNKEINKGFKYNEQVDLLPLWADGGKPEGLIAAVAESAGVKPEDILASELALCCRTPAMVWDEGRLVSAPRLDDLQCAFATLSGFLAAEPKAVSVWCCFDNEEVGSRTKQGAAGSFFGDTLSRISAGLGRTAEEHLRALASSFMLSADNAHAVHPNHPEFSDAENRVRMNAGVVVKVNAAQSYATDGTASGLLRLLCQRTGTPVQSFANRSDLQGGGTLGNVATLHVSIRMADVGLPQLAMHSCYETAGAKDTGYLADVSQALFASRLRETAPGVLELA